MISNRQIQHVLAVAKSRNLTRAAEEQNISQSALTRSVSTVEEQVGAKLFDRSKQGMVPTQICELILPKLSFAMGNLKDIEHEVQSYKNIERGELNIAIGGAIFNSLLSAVLPIISKTYPEIFIQAVSSSVDSNIKLLLSREIDLIASSVNSYEADERFDTLELGTIPLRIFVRRNHPLCEKETLSLADIVSFPIMVPQKLSAFQSQFTLSQLAKKHPPRVVCQDYNVLKKVSLETDNCTIAPVFQFQEETETGDLCRLDFEMQGFSIRLGIISIAGRSFSPSASAFIETCREYVASTNI